MKRFLFLILIYVLSYADEGEFNLKSWISNDKFQDVWYKAGVLSGSVYGFTAQKRDHTQLLSIDEADEFALTGELSTIYIGRNYKETHRSKIKSLNYELVPWSLELVDFKDGLKVVKKHCFLRCSDMLMSVSANLPSVWHPHLIYLYQTKNGNNSNSCSQHLYDTRTGKVSCNINENVACHL